MLSSLTANQALASVTDNGSLFLRLYHIYMKLHKEGIATIAVTSLVVAGIIWATYYFITSRYPAIGWLITIAALGLLVFILSFFRIPARTHTESDDFIVAPCDGKVVVIEEVQADEYFKDKRLQVSIFMSPLNVHVNRNPVSGEVVYSQYHKGKYLVAWHPKSSTDNERHSVVYKHRDKELLVKQIAGALAKRIVNYLKPGAVVQQGAEMGFIKFGSRVDLLLPLDTKIDVALNQVVKGGVTVIGHWV
jgi:phosphatidylserine decarboxylase